MPPDRRTPHDPGPTLSPSFTLGTALSWLGHDCRGGCPGPMTASRATVWFTRLPSREPRWTHTLVEVEFAGSPWSAPEVRRLGAQVNECVHADHLQVREMRTSGRDTVPVVECFAVR